jgi:hypothetical protein
MFETETRRKEETRDSSVDRLTAHLQLYVMAIRLFCIAHFWFQVPFFPSSRMTDPGISRQSGGRLRVTYPFWDGGEQIKNFYACTLHLILVQKDNGNLDLASEYGLLRG